MSGFAQSLDQQQNTEFQSMANRGFDFMTGGVTIKSAAAAAEAEAGQSLQDTGSGLLGTATSVGIGRAVLGKVAQVKKAAQAAKQAAQGKSDAATDDALGLGDDAADDLPALAGDVAPAGGDAVGGAVTAATDVAADATEAGSILAGGADAEAVLAGSGVGETPIGLVAMAGVGLVMGIAGFFMHRHAEKHAEKTTPVVQEQQAATNYFVQKGV